MATAGPVFISHPDAPVRAAPEKDRAINEKRSPLTAAPRKGGNTEILLKKVLEPIAAAGIETELIQVGGTEIRGCRGLLRLRQDRKTRAAPTITIR